MRYIKGQSNDPYFNLAAEEYYFGTDEDVFMLWVNAPSVIVGCNQNARAEINYKFIKENSIAVARRISGGGAVFHDYGNINFTFLTKDKNFGDYDKYSKCLVEFLNSIGCPAELKGRNDLSADEMKISGMAQKISKNRIMHHGCILFDTDLSALSGALMPDMEKIKSKGIASVRKRVCNIKDFVDMDREEFFQALEKWMTEKLSLTVRPMTDEEKEKIDVLRKKIAANEYIYGAAPKYSFHNKKRFEGGTVEVYLLTHHGKIEEIKFYGDFFMKGDMGKVEESLKGVLHSEEEILKVLKKEGLLLDRITLDEFISVMF